MAPSEGEFGVVGKAIDDFLDALSYGREERDLLILDHRVKNLLATVQAVSQQTFRSTGDPKEAVEVFGRRLAALAEGQSLLMKETWKSARMLEVVQTAVRPFEDSQLFHLSGPDFVIQSKGALALSMALHELCTNAAKHGAPSVEGGVVVISWEIPTSHAGEEQLTFRWEERGGPPVNLPQHTGFGSRMIKRILGHELAADIMVDYHETGLVCQFIAPMHNLTNVEAGMPNADGQILRPEQFPAGRVFRPDFSNPAASK